MTVAECATVADACRHALEALVEPAFALPRATLEAELHVALRLLAVEQRRAHPPTQHRPHPDAMRRNV